MRRGDAFGRPRVHLCLVEPPGYAHSGALLDPMTFFHHQLERAGAVVTAAKNELVQGSVNYVFGAHLGLTPAHLAGHQYVVVNLEQLGTGGADLPPGYVELLSVSPVVDYHPDNAAAYSREPGSTKLVRLGYASYLDAEPVPLEERDIDLLFIGILTPRRLDVLRVVEASGQSVTVTDRPVYGAERDALVRRAKAVLNVGAYETNRFEQVRASVVLSCGTPMVSEARPWSSPADQRFMPFVHWFDPRSPAAFFGESFDTRAFFESSRSMLAAWRNTDVLQDYVDLMTPSRTPGDRVRAGSPTIPTARAQPMHSALAAGPA